VKFSDLGEFGFINRIARRYPIQSPYILKGIGDDAAVISFSDDLVILLTADQLIEGFHFRIDETEGKRLGAKALAVNLSDIAAMGGYPIGYTVSLGIPSQRIALDFLDAFYEGITGFGKMMGVALIGGDTSESGERFFISLALLGKASKGKVIYRGGGKDGDLLYVTGWLGDAALGLRISEQGGNRAGKENLLARHFSPLPRVKEGQVLAERGIPNAMIDISDGLLADLNHIVEQSGVGAEVDLSGVPRSPEFQIWARDFAADPLSLALSGGEDYELLFSVSPEKSIQVAQLSQELDVPLTCIGRLAREIKGIWLKDEQGRSKKAEPWGYDHFKTG
jgi:thiamine-monophosphate kinase